ncbi:hypothetical protein TWF730_003953 [Orbilia blumenaviensis]|uniref:Protein kinase domain-containing protein n=1 Tax=Orbilia blumenaviensis TaxID=1796055 RepID=A0AAV9U1L5_9PEZI
MATSTSGVSGSKLTSFFARRGFVSVDSFASRTSSIAGETEHDLLSFLAIAQANEVDFLPITWQPNLGTVGAGGTANIQQSSLDEKLSYVFKRIHRGIDEPYAYKVLVSEISILGHKEIRDHPNIVRLSGICWDVISSLEPIWPVLVFQKSEHGDLKNFMCSGAGISLGFDQKLKLCDDVAVGITALHEMDIVHGDIKPMNVLIFTENNSSDSEMKYIAKIGDFGYSTFLEQQVDESLEDGIQLPISRPWNAPEVANWSRSFTLLEAKLTDVYSFGLMTLWLLFNNQLLELGLDINNPAIDLEWKQEEKLKGVALGVVEKQDYLQADQREGVGAFFISTLAENPEARSLNIKELTARFIAARQLPNKIYSLYDQWAPYKKYTKHKDYYSGPAEEAYASHLSTPIRNPYDYYNPYHPLNLYPSSPSTGYLNTREGMYMYPNTTKSRGSHFLVYRSFKQLVKGDYRAWKLIFDALKNRASSHDTGESDRMNAAYQLAFCYEMGFGTVTDQEKVDFYLSQALKLKATLNHEIQIIREDRQDDLLMFKRINERIAIIDHVNHYLETEKLGDIQAAYEAITQATNVRLGEDHPISKTLSSILGSLSSIAETIDKADSDAQPSCKSTPSVGEVEELVTINMQNKTWGRAVELQQEVVELKEEKFGRAHSQTISAMLKLANCWKKQGWINRAEEVAVDALTRTSGGNLEVLEFLSSLYEDTENWSKFVDLLKKIIESKRLLLGIGHEETLKDLKSLVWAYIRWGKLAEAAGFQRMVVNALKDSVGAQNPDTLSSLELLATILEKVGVDGEAVTVMREVVLHKENFLGLEHTETIDAQGTLKEYERKLSEAVFQERLMGVVARSRRMNTRGNYAEEGKS